MSDTSAGFRWRGTLSGEPQRKERYLTKDTETITAGDIMNLESGEVDLGATNDSAFLGIALETVSGVDSTTYVWVTTNADAVFGVYDPNARTIGDRLDLSGATGAQTVTTNSNSDFVVVATKTAAHTETLVTFAPGEHATT